MKITATDETETRKTLEDLIPLANDMGMTKAAFISPEKIIVDEKLADYCKPPNCPQYGIAASCPPHVSGPAGFRQLLKKAVTALVFYMEVPMEALMSPEKEDIYRHLHNTAVLLEKTAVSKGFAGSKSFAGGSCKNLFCKNEPSCRVVAENGPCRHPDAARASMSGYGINVFAMCDAVGRSMDKITQKTNRDEIRTGTAVGLLVIQ